MKTLLSDMARADTLRVAMVAPSLDILGGQGVQARNLAQGLMDEGVDVAFIPVNPRFPMGLRWLRRIPVVRTLFNQLLYVCSLWRLRRADVIHVFSAAYWSFLLAPLPAILIGRLFGKRVILNYHSGEADDHLANWGWLVHPWLRLASTIVVPSVYLQETFARYGHDAQVVRNFIDLSGFRYRERTTLRPVFFSNRNLEPHYGLFNTLEAFVRIQERIPEAKLVIAGYGSQLKRLKQEIAERNIQGVSVLGRVEPKDMPRLYDEADVFLNSSLIDNQPISILEAFASGIPVVTTPTGDIAAMTQHGRCSVLVPHDEPQAMADAVIALLESGNQAAAMAGRARAVAASYCWAEVYHAWLAVYQGNESETATTP